MRGSTEFYDNDPEGYSKKTFDADVSEIRDRFLKYVPKGSKILDLGCGSGRDTLFFSRNGYVPVPVDGSEGMCAIARRNTGIEVRRLMFSDLDYENEFDAVWACSTLLHVPSKELPDIMSKVRRAMKDGAVFYLSFKEGTFEGCREGRMYTDMTQDSLRSLCERCGFRTLEIWSSLEPGRQTVWCNAIVRK